MKNAWEQVAVGTTETVNGSGCGVRVEKVANGARDVERQTGLGRSGRGGHRCLQGCCRGSLN